MLPLIARYSALSPASARTDWVALKQQLRQQWRRLSEHELNQVGSDRKKLAQLIAKKYGLSFTLVESYLNNLETMLLTLN